MGRNTVRDEAKRGKGRRGQSSSAALAERLEAAAEAAEASAGMPVSVHAPARGASARSLAAVRRLSGAVERLGQRLAARDLETAVIGRLSGVLQVCSGLEEACAMVTTVVAPIFPGFVGEVWVTPWSDGVAAAAAPGEPRGPQRLERLGRWGSNTCPGEAANSDAEGAAPRIDASACWGLRRGRTHSAGAGAKAPLCEHVAPNEPLASLCVPLQAGGETLGVLHLRGCDVHVDGTEAARVAEIVGETFSLALANLRLRDALRHQAVRDPLSGLFNRRYLDETMDRELMRARRSNGPVSVLVVDVDLFKSINDTFGHTAGDEVIRAISQALSNALRGSDVVSRYGGEEFVAVLPDAPLEVGMRRAEELRAAVRRLELHHAGRRVGPLSVSIGVAAWPAHGDDRETLIREADAALYRAKRAGRDRVVVAGGIDEALPGGTWAA